MYAELFHKYAALGPVVENICSKNPNYVLAKLDVTTINLGRMPTAEEIREFNKAIKTFIRSLTRALGLKPRGLGLLYCDEFGGKNSNLHAHCLYVGPRISREWLGKGGKISKLWKNACEKTSFKGSFIVSIKHASSFGQGLGHALKYAGKFLDRDPVRLAILERAFHGVRRVHTLGALYNVLPDQDSDEGAVGPICPTCNSAVISQTFLCAVVLLVKEGRADIDECRKIANRKRFFARDG
jgi:hypothetical protein